jgi:hypothetical protein
MLEKLSQILSAAKDKIESYLRAKKGLSPPPSLEVAKDITELLPVRITKIALLN